ncbi:Alpha/Beta hydrolase protein [Mycena galericulata]|nr:Alpha/Beta hydrolase protein [Mycena galericulata]
MAPPLSSAQNFPTVDLGYAQYQGTVGAVTNITYFLGIRYAAAPLGDLRFRAPQAPLNVTGVQPATVQPNECMQASPGLSPINPFESRATAVNASEDCLFLNVYYPSNEVGDPVRDLPIVVWIHGGAYISGAASSYLGVEYNGEDIIWKSNHGVVVVAIQYRLPRRRRGKDGALNAGLLDQDFALRWVNQHISKFGGDPSKVTIWGQSAGAGFVMQHVVANGGNTTPQLFRACCTSATDAMACLRAADPSVLETANNNINLANFYFTFSVGPVVDGEFITQRPTLSLAQGMVNGQYDSAANCTIFVNQSVSVTAVQYSLELFPGFTTAQADTVGTLYAGLGSNLFQVDAVQGESIFICPTYYLLDAFPGKSFKVGFSLMPFNYGTDFDSGRIWDPSA